MGFWYVATLPLLLAILAGTQGNQECNRRSFRCQKFTIPALKSRNPDIDQICADDSWSRDCMGACMYIYTDSPSEFAYFKGINYICDEANKENVKAIAQSECYTAVHRDVLIKFDQCLAASEGKGSGAYHWYCRSAAHTSQCMGDFARQHSCDESVASTFQALFFEISNGLIGKHRPECGE